jgi:DGQHR domain-containing protein
MIPPTMAEERESSGSPAERKTLATRFEQTVKDLMSRLEFDGVDGARDNFLVNGIQVDVCGGHEDTLIVVECTRSSRVDQERSLRAKISQLRGTYLSLQKGFQALNGYKNYKHLQLVLATQHIKVRREDRDFANAAPGPRVYIWDDNLREYYEDLFEKIGPYAKFNLLGEMGIRPIKQGVLKLSALEYLVGKTRMYLFFVDPKVLLEVAYVARRERPAERFYQREIKKARLKAIAAYINSPGNLLPNNLIIAFGPGVARHVKFQEQSSVGGDFKTQMETGGAKVGTLEFPMNYRSCWVVDGQHRLYSFIQVARAMAVPVLAFKDLELERQCKFFLDINKFQKPVNADLIWDLNGEMLPSEQDGIISNVVKKLNDDPSPFCRRVFIPSRGARKKRGTFLRMAGFCLAIKRVRLVSPNTKSRVANPFYIEDATAMVESLSKRLSEYFFCVSEVLQHDWQRGKKGFSAHDIGVAVFIRFLEKIIARHKDKGIPDLKTYRRYLSPLEELLKDSTRLHRWRKSGSSEGAKDEILVEFINHVASALNDVKFGTQTGLSGKDVFVVLEENFQNLVKKEYGMRLLEKVPQDIRNTIQKRLETQRIGQEKAYRELTLGQCAQIFRTDRPAFYQHFVLEDKASFYSEDAFGVAMTHVTRMRNMESHSKGSQRQLGDEDLLRTYMEKINGCLSRALQADYVGADQDIVDEGSDQDTKDQNEEELDGDKI